MSAATMLDMVETIRRQKTTAITRIVRFFTGTPWTSTLSDHFMESGEIPPTKGSSSVAEK
ncbi:MAG: hypothetical protein ACLFU7_06015 [Armatimonadota bacterium]